MGSLLGTGAASPRAPLGPRHCLTWVWVGLGEGSRAALPLPESAGLSVEQKLSGSHKALVEMQDLVAELLKTVPREYPATKVSRAPPLPHPPSQRLPLLPFTARHGPRGLG